MQQANGAGHGPGEIDEPKAGDENRFEFRVAAIAFRDESIVLSNSQDNTSQFQVVEPLVDVEELLDVEQNMTQIIPGITVRI